MKKLLRFAAVALALGCCAAGCVACGDGEGGGTTELQGYEAIMDPTMSNGVDVLGTVSIIDGSTVTYEFDYMGTVPDNAVAQWKLGQWGTKFGYADYGKQTKEGDNYILSDGHSKEFIVNPTTGQYSLNCYTEDEYPEPRPNGADWLHLITIQNVVDISRVSEMENIYVDLDFSVDFCENRMTESEFNPDLHSALFQWVFVLTNVNPDSPDYNNYFWLNIPYYDGRSLTIDSWKQFEEFSKLDDGKEDKSNTFIYSAGSEAYLPEEGVQIGERYHITIDLVPYIERAIESIQQNPQNANSAYPILMNTTLDDLRINQFYIGWEVPGTFDCGVTIYKNSLLYNKAE